jgi:putative ATP-dependent endonuclease of OLD family
LAATFKAQAKAIHAGGGWDADFEKQLAEKLFKKTLNKTEIAYLMATAIDKDIKDAEAGTIPAKTINIDPANANDSINYLVKAIQYASGN